MIKKYFFTTLLLLCFHQIQAQHEQTGTSDLNRRQRDKLERALHELPDSVFGDVKKEDLLEDEVYVKLARDGWSSKEIVTIMNTAMKDRKAAKEKFGYGQYAKQWFPSFGYTPGGDSIYQFIDTTYNVEMLASVHRTVPDNVVNAWWEKKIYNPDDRKKGIRQPAYFRTVEHKPSSGRIHWAQMHPEDPDKLLVIPDGAGIFKTDDGGKNWVCITDKIPLREHRSTALHSAIPVDPDDWNHVFAFMNGNTVYQTTDGGDTWRRIEGATHKSFKRGHAFRDKAGNLKFIGAQQQGGTGYWASKLWISEDTCKTWTEVIVPEELKDRHPELDGKGAWFQQIEFDPTDRDKIYLPTSRSIFYFDDGAKSTMVDGRRTYNIKKMEFQVYDETRTQLRRDPDEPDNATLFPVKATSSGHLVVNPNNPSQMWFATGIRRLTKSAVYYSEDKGRTWITLNEPTAGIGSGCAFGNETPWGWLGGFGVNLRDPNWVYGCSMSSAISSDGGRNFKEYAWGNRLKSMQEDGNYYHVTNSRHNADNHFILSHKSGRVFRGSDSGLLVKDLDIQNNEWTNIGGNMGQMLYYTIRVNEFGDQVMAGNTQDIDVQTYRYGRWGSWRGYEGSEISINPYTNTCYFSGSGGGGLENLPLSSWGTTKTWADVHTGSWYILRTTQGASLLRVDDIGRSVINLYDNVGDNVSELTLARDKGHTTLFVRTAANILKMSVDGGNSFQNIMVNGVPAKFTNTQLATDPDNSDILYLGQTGKVLRFYVNEGRWETLDQGLPAVSCDDLLFHEGSGDLYFMHKGSGIYILENGSDTWRFWTKGFNPAKFREAVINYTTQEMVLQDYGRGVWVADLEHPADRYFNDGFELKELSHVDGRRTIGIDTRWTIPLYYHYEWTVNGEPADNPYQYLTADLKPGDKIRLKLTLRESPDVSTVSAEYTVGTTESVHIEPKAGNALYSNGAGRIDIGYVDYFRNDFSIDCWVKPAGNGVLLANRQKSFDKGAKGFILFVENGQLKFRYSPSNIFSKPTYEPASDEQKTLSGGNIDMNQWSHIAVTESRDGTIRLYVNGIKTSEEARYRPEHSLNNSTYLSLFADAFEYEAIEATVDELKIWNRELSENEIRREMYSTSLSRTDGPVVYYSFNGDSLESCQETFARYQPRRMTRAQVRLERMPVPTNARKAAYDTLTAEGTVFEAQGVKLLGIHNENSTRAFAMGVYTFRAQQWLETPSNLDEKYHEVAADGYLFHSFTPVGNDSLTIRFFAGESAYSPDKRYRLYYTEATGTDSYWQLFGNLSYDPASGALLAQHVPADKLNGKKLLVVSMKPAIELSVEGLSAQGELHVYSEDKAQYAVQATLVENLKEPDSAYAFTADSPILQPQGAFYFTKGEARSAVRLHADSLGAFGETRTVTLSGKDDDRMVPTPIRLVNRITPKEIGGSVLIENGGITIGSSSDFQALHQSNTVTLAGWIRIDKASVLTGNKPLLFFRSSSPSVATGLHLQDGNLRCHWNEESWSWNTATSLNVTADDLGRWLHIALVVRPDGVDYYLNGTRHTVNRTVNKGRIHNMLMLGQNFQGDTWFSGAFDQVGVWSRSLSQQEIIRYMHERVLLNDSALVAYLNMDYTDEHQRLKELKQGLSVKTYGTISLNHRSTAPFNPRPAATAGKEPLSLQFPDGKETGYRVNTYEGHPYNYFSRSRQADLPLNREFYTLTYETVPGFAADDSLTLHYRHAGILAGDSLTLAIRPIGSENPFSSFVAQKADTDGTVRFRVPASQLRQTSELMLFVSPESGKRPAKVEVNFATEQPAGGNYMLAEQETDIPLRVKVLSGNDNDSVIIAVKETAYASLDREQIDMSNNENGFIIRIDREKLDKMGLNPITVNVNGAEAETFAFQVYLEPEVRLSLKNGDSEHDFTATSPTPTLEIEAELLQGYLDRNVELEVVADVNSAMSIGGGNLLLDRPVTVQLAHHTSPYGKADEGWNLTGNPYLANINLTKHQNVGFDRQKVTKFVYHYDRELDNYLTSDMTVYDDEQSILPLQAYFVQTMAPDAEFTVTPVAKSTVLNRRTLDYYTASEYTSVRLTLQSASGKPADRTDVVWEDGASTAFVVNEDAPKLESMNPASNQLYALAGGKETSVNTVPQRTEEVQLGVHVGTPGEMILGVSRMNGFGDNEWLVLHDSHTGAEWFLSPDNEYRFNAWNEGTFNDRFTLKVKRENTTVGIDDNEADRYRIYVSDGRCTIDGLQGDALISLFNTHGQLMLRETCRQHSYSVTLQPGGYVIKIRENEKEYISKIVVK